MTKDTKKPRKEKISKPDYGNGSSGTPVKEDGNDEQQSNRDSKKEVPTFEVSIDWKLEAERLAWLAALNEDIYPRGGMNNRGSNNTDVV